MRVCYNCQPPRLNLGRPDFCQFCGASFQYRICLNCRAKNSPHALRCGACGRNDLSELGSPAPAWLRLFPLVICAMGLWLLWEGAQWLFAAAVQVAPSVLTALVVFFIFFTLLPPSLREVLKFFLSLVTAPLRLLCSVAGWLLWNAWQGQRARGGWQRRPPFR